MANVPIDGATLRWAREVMFVERDELARAAGTKPERIAEFEEGGTPTFRQLSRMAKKLDRPLGFFFAPPPVETDVPATADFRGGSADEIPPLLAREMRRAEQHRETVLEFDGTPPRSVVGATITWSNVAERAAQMRTALGLTDGFVPPESGPNQVFNFWRGLLEDHGVLVFQTTRIPLIAYRGLSVHHDVLPIILINGSDASNGKVFTLFHEIAHLANRTNGLCMLRERVGVEALANAFSADFLMPRARVARSVTGLNASAHTLAEHISSEFKVSMVAAAVRLKTMGVVTDAEMQTIWSESNEQWERHRLAQKEADGGPHPWRLRFRDLGAAYVGTVVRALDDGRVDWLDATYLLDARLTMAEQIVDEYRRTEGHG